MDKNVIPPITDKLGKYWEQPPVASILVDDKNAIMDVRSFEALKTYSRTIPTGVYDGKMWKAFRPELDWQRKREMGETPRNLWYLVWYGEGNEPKNCSINAREIILLDGELPTQD